MYSAQAASRSWSLGLNSALSTPTLIFRLDRLHWSSSSRHFMVWSSGELLGPADAEAGIVALRGAISEQPPSVQRPAGPVGSGSDGDARHTRKPKLPLHLKERRLTRNDARRTPGS
jgi:hypothetical protein